MKKTLIILYKIFFVGLLLQFFLQTFITFKLGIDTPGIKYIRLWKEAVIVFLLLLSFVGIIRERKWKQIFTNSTIGRWTLGLIVSIIITGLIHFQVLDLGIGTYVLAFKYDFFGFIILLAGFHSSSFLEKEDKRAIILRYGKFIKYALILSLLWYFVIFIKPGTLKLFGYDNFAFEGTVNMAPPAAYYNLINHGITRNQFLFERPISRGFFLVAFFPFFFISFLYKKPFKNTWFRRGIFGLNIFLTFSRAARGARILEMMALTFFLSRKSVQKILLKLLIPGVLFFGFLGATGYQKYFKREYSDSGHIEMLNQSINIITRRPLRGQGGSSAGPGSHWKGEETNLRREGMDPKDGFNPENQYLQILIEFGLIGFIGRFLIYLTITFIGFKELHKNHRIIYNQTKDTKYSASVLFIFACSVGMIGLSLEGLVLHSFSDRMIVYPFMLLFGIIRMQYFQEKKV